MSSNTGRVASQRTRRATLILFTLTVTFVIGASPLELSAQQRWSWPDEPENLQVLPKTFKGSNLRAVMTGFTRALGVRCSHCHVGEEGQPLGTYDFPSDDNPKKEVARTMLRLLGVVNDTLNTVQPVKEKRVNMWCHTCHRGRPLPMALPEELARVYESDGTDATVAHYEDLHERFYGRGAYDFGEGSLNQFGYRLLGQEQLDAAITIFALNAEQYPESYNVWDSLGEVHMKAGNKEKAIEYYEKSLALEPRNENAAKMLKELRQ